MCKLVIHRVSSSKNPQNLDPSNKMDLHFWGCFGIEKKNPSYNRRDTVITWSGNYLGLLFSLFIELYMVIATTLRGNIQIAHT